MTVGLLVSIGACALVFLISGVRSPAYLFLFLAYIPFVSFDAEMGGLQDAGGLGGASVQLKMALRLLTTAVLVVLLLRRRGALAHAFRPSCWPILVFVGWALAGLLLVDAPLVTVFRLGELFAFFLIGVCLFTEGDRRRKPRAVARGHCLALLPLSLATLYTAWANPELAYHTGVAGIRLGHRFVEANVLGFAACVTLLWATHELREKRENERHWAFERLVPALVLAVSIAVLIYARSRTAMITATAGQFLLWFPFYRGDARRRTLFLAFALVGLCTVAVNADIIMGWFLRGDSMVNLLNGTGRTGLWRALLTEQVPRSPFFGSGYLTLSESGFFEHNGTWWTNAHNTFLFALVSTGIPGFIAVVAITVLPLRATFRRVFDAAEDDRASWVLLFALQVVVAITGITGFGITGYPNAVMLFNYGIYLYCVSRPRPPVALRPAASATQPRSARYCMRSRTPTPVPQGPPW